jgi:hypothetical protein
MVLLPFCAIAQTTNFSATWNATDFAGASIVKQVQLDPLLAYTVNGTNIVTGDSHVYSMTSFPYVQTNSLYFVTNSSITVSNLTPGSYRTTFRGQSKDTIVTNVFPYGTTGNVIASQTNYLGSGGLFVQGGVFTMPYLKYSGFVSGSNLPSATSVLTLTASGSNQIAAIASAAIVSSNGVTAAGVSNIVNPIVLTSSNGVLVTASNAFYLNSNPSNYVTASITNGLATTVYAQSLTNGFVGSGITNGLATTNFVKNQGYVTQTITNGLATTNFVLGQGFVTQSITNGLATTSFVNAGILSATNSVLTISSNAFYAKSNPSNFVVLTELNSASNYLQSLIVNTTNGITAGTATNIANASSAAALAVATNYANTNTIARVLAQGTASTNYTMTASNSVYGNATNSAGTIAATAALNATNGFVGTMNAAILTATNAFTNKVNALILTATNAIGTASGLSAFQNTNFFDLAGAGTAAALAATNGLPTMAFASTNQFIRTNALPALTNSFATTNYVNTATNNFGNSIAINMTNAANKVTLSQLTIGGATLVYITNVVNNTNTIMAGGALAGSYFYSPYTNAFNGSYVSSANSSYFLTNSSGMFTASASLTNSGDFVSTNWILGDTPLTTTAYTYYALVTNYPVVINTVIITNGVYAGDGSKLTNITVTASATNIIINSGGVGTNLTVYGTLTSTNLTAIVNAATLAATNNLGNTIPTLMTNEANQFTGIFTGNGSGLSGTTATATNAIGNLNGTGTNLTVYGTLTSTNLTSSIWVTDFTIPNYRTNFSVVLAGVTTNLLIDEKLFLVAMGNNPYGLLLLSNTMIPTKYVAGQSYAGCPPFSQSSTDGISWSISYDGDNAVSFQDTNGSPATFTAIQVTNAFKLQARYSWVKHQ